MNQQQSILTELKEKFMGKSNPDIINAWLIEAPEGIELVYELFKDLDCTVTYRHKVYMWGSDDRSRTYTREEMLEKGWSKDELDEISNDPPYTEYECFMDDYVYGADVLTLAMNTNLFTEEGGLEIIETQSQS